MRGLLAKRLRFHLPIAFGLSLIAAIAFKVSRIILNSFDFFGAILHVCFVHYCFIKEKESNLELVFVCHPAMVSNLFFSRYFIIYIYI